MAAGEEEEAALQSVAQGTRWTYSLLWKLCPQQGALVWAEGHYNGAVKTRKTVRPGGDDDDDAGQGGEEAAARKRSRQLRALYDSLAGEAASGGGGGSGSTSTTARRPCAALAPEDLAETEWFYLMCASYCFPPGIGLPGTAYATRRHVWLTGANQADSKVFQRAILAKSAGIQTVACIPVADYSSVLEIGTTDKVEEDVGLIQYARSIFMDQQQGSGHSTTRTHDSPALQMMNHRRLDPEDDKKRSEIEDDDDIFDTQGLEHDNNGNAGSMLMQVVASDRAKYGCSSYVAEGQGSIIPPAENANYAEAVLRVLRRNVDRSSGFYLTPSTNSSFSRWTTKRPAVDHCRRPRNGTMMVSEERAPQRMLKAAVLLLKEAGRDNGEGQAPQELSGSHVLKERRRREKLNERFVVLRSLVPFVTKMDRASILGDTIEYLKQLRRRVQDLEARSSRHLQLVDAAAAAHETRGGGYFTRAAAEVQVSIIDSDALVELRCAHRDGLLLRVLQAAHRDLGMEVTDVQASSAGGVLLAELRAKVNEVHGRRSSIAQVKRAIHLILSSD